MTPNQVTEFWTKAVENRWFDKSASFDGELSVGFRDVLARAREGEFDHWAESSDGALGLVILLDQFSRNIHRGSPLMFAGDKRALETTRQAIRRGFHQAMPAERALWFVLPFEHAEDLDAQWRAVGLFQTMGLNDMTPWARLHLDVIQRFGRFPHRNPILGRTSTREELDFLARGGFAG
jgi:uncharacterized protein (DUF924 family)